MQFAGMQEQGTRQLLPCIANEKHMSHGFEEKAVVISGAGKGLGRAYALYLAGLGAHVVVNNRRHAGEMESSADRVVSQIRENGGNAIAEYSSAEDPAAGERLLKTSLEAFGRLDAVIANAGISEGRSFNKQSVQEFRQVIEINLMGTAHLLHPAFRHMYEQRRGSLIVSSSVAGLYGEHGLPAYSASKAALLGLMYSLSAEGASHGIRVNALAPFATTQMTEENLPPALQDKLQAEHVAPVLAWLISDNCDLNGETIICGAGKIARARMMETAVLNISSGLDYDPEKLQRLWKNLEALPLDQMHRGALEQFGNFIAD